MSATHTTNATGTSMSRTFLGRLFTSAACLLLLLATAVSAHAQTTGGGAIQGTVTDPSGAAIPGAKITATAQASGTKVAATASSAGLFDITPLIPGLYTLQVEAVGFKDLKQENIEVDGLNITGFNPKLSVGSQDQVVTVSEAPPQLQTTSATVGAVITTETYESLPLVMNNQQRDPTAFATLAPGAQTGSRAPLFPVPATTLPRSTSTASPPPPRTSRVTTASSSTASRSKLSTSSRSSPPAPALSIRVPAPSASASRPAGTSITVRPSTSSETPSSIPGVSLAIKPPPPSTSTALVNPYLRASPSNIRTSSRSPSAAPSRLRATKVSSSPPSTSTTVARASSPLPLPYPTRTSVAATSPNWAPAP